MVFKGFTQCGREARTSFERSVSSPLSRLCDLLPEINMQWTVLKTGLTPSASGSSYFEFQPGQRSKSTILPHCPNLKLICNVHGPKPLPRSAPFTPQLLLSAYVKFAPFASWHRRGWVRDGTERDLCAHLETALRSVIIGERSLVGRDDRC